MSTELIYEIIQYQVQCLGRHNWYDYCVPYPSIELAQQAVEFFRQFNPNGKFRILQGFVKYYIKE